MMSKTWKIFEVLLIGVCLISCATPTDFKTNSRLTPIGHIEFDPKIDTLDFKLCHADLISPHSPHEGVGYEGEKPAIIREFEQGFKPLSHSDEDGYVTIRFLVNCEGEAGMYRIIEMDENYQLKEFSSDLADQILSITTSLKGWKPGFYDNEVYDYYQYLTFKISDGDIVDILP